MRSLVLLLIVAGASNAYADVPLTLGTVTRVVCRSSPGHSYELFLPATYDPSKSWPIVYALDAEKRGEVPIERLRDAAARYGYVIASSNDTSSDGASEANADAFRAMWNDTRSRLKIDPSRVFLAGFSATARAAYTFATTRRLGRVAGIIAASGGLPTAETEPVADLAFFGTAGTHDFNYLEMKSVDQKLEDSGVPHALEIFDGGHEWPPVETMTRALEWMHIQTLRTGMAAIDDGDLQSIAARWSAAAAALERRDLLRAVAMYGEVTEHFGIVTSKVSTRAMQIVRSERYKHAARQEHRALSWEARERGRILLLLSEAASPATPMPSLETLEKRLKLREIRKFANGKEGAFSRAAHRVLAHARFNAGHYLPSHLASTGQRERAEFLRRFAETALGAF